MSVGRVEQLGPVQRLLRRRRPAEEVRRGKYLVLKEKYLLCLWQVPTADPDQRAGAGLPGRQQGGVPVPVLPLPRPRPRPAPRGAAQQRQVRGGEAAAGGVPEHAARSGGQGLPHTQAGDTDVKMTLQTRVSNERSRRFHNHGKGLLGPTSAFTFKTLC